jgi:hypothetical protein
LPSGGRADQLLTRLVLASTGDTLESAHDVAHPSDYTPRGNDGRLSLSVKCKHAYSHDGAADNTLMFMIRGHVTQRVTETPDPKLQPTGRVFLGQSPATLSTVRCRAVHGCTAWPQSVAPSTRANGRPVTRPPAHCAGWPPSPRGSLPLAVCPMHRPSRSPLHAWHTSYCCGASPTHPPICWVHRWCQPNTSGSPSYPASPASQQQQAAAASSTSQQASSCCHSCITPATTTSPHPNHQIVKSQQTLQPDTNVKTSTLPATKVNRRVPRAATMPTSLRQLSMLQTTELASVTCRSSDAPLRGLVSRICSGCCQAVLVATCQCNTAAAGSEGPWLICTPCKLCLSLNTGSSSCCCCCCCCAMPAQTPLIMPSDPWHARCRTSREKQFHP